MSVIAWDGKMLAADRRAGTSCPRSVTKIRRAANGNLMGASGNAQGDQELMRWYDLGADPITFPATQRLADENYSMLLVIERGSNRIMQYCGYPTPAVFEDAQFAMGSGRDFALMAMLLGKTARDAVILTSELCAECGNGYDMLEFD